VNQGSAAAPIRFLDLLAQKRRLEPALSQRLSAVLAHGQFVLGPEVAELELQLASFCGARLRGRQLGY
jgi:UDP-2-acetamido-2-deoxy-ribo-hexuluronate aminotransferase